MKVHATAKFVRIAPRKARLVVDAVRGLSVAEAVKMLTVMNKKAAEPVLKLIQSAVANAEHNYKLQKDSLFVSEIRANEGFVMKRFMPRAFGRASTIRKKTSHLHVTLDERVVKQSAKVAPKKVVKKKEDKK